MSLLGSKTAIVSVGVSCQTSHQIRNHASFLQQATGDASLKTSRLPFDWLICGIPAAARMIARNKFFPEARSEIELVARPYWRAADCFFWHDFVTPGINMKIATEQTIGEQFENETSRYRHIAGKWQQLQSIQRRIFVVSNTQSGLDGYRNETGIFDEICRVEDLHALTQSIDAAIPGHNEFIFVFHPDRYSGNLRTLENSYVFDHVPRHQHWMGDDKPWAEVFKHYFASCTPGADWPISWPVRIAVEKNAATPA